MNDQQTMKLIEAISVLGDNGIHAFYVYLATQVLDSLFGFVAAMSIIIITMKQIGKIIDREICRERNNL